MIWSGPSATGGSAASNIHDLHPCTYRALPHLCFWQGSQRGTHGSGVGVILDQHYQLVRTVHPRAVAAAAAAAGGTGTGGVDFHEFRLTPSNTALIVTYQPKFINGMWVLDNCFEEVSLDDVDEFGNHGSSGTAGGSSSSSSSSKGPLFEWCATDHIALTENPGLDNFLAEARGNGKVPDRAWDYVHINSVDKSPEDGTYLVSARHLDTIFAVSPDSNGGGSGSILWRLGGPRSSFSQNGFGFARQHDARFVHVEPAQNDKGKSLTISLLDNANDGLELKKNPSKALVVHLDLTSMNARRVAEYGAIPPETNELRRAYIASTGMGNVQYLPSSSHVLTSFGRFGAMAEYTAEGGAPVFYADFTAPSTLPSSARWSASNYRTYLQPSSDSTSPPPWVGQPDERPALWTYARTPTNLMTFYVSWNGAVSAATYRFWISDSQSQMPPPPQGFSFAGTWPKSGFETNFTIGSARPWSFAEALDAEGRSLANSSVVRTYVPALEDRKGCGKWHCFPDVTRLRTAELVPLDDGAALREDRQVGGFDGPGTVALLEHIFALVGLGLCAWWVWTRIRQDCRHRRGYRPVDKEEGDGAVAI